MWTIILALFTQPPTHIWLQTINLSRKKLLHYHYHHSAVNRKFYGASKFDDPCKFGYVKWTKNWKHLLSHKEICHNTQARNYQYTKFMFIIMHWYSKTSNFNSLRWPSSNVDHMKVDPNQEGKSGDAGRGFLFSSYPKHSLPQWFSG